MDQTQGKDIRQSLGSWLRQTRESMGHTLSEVEEATRIRRKFLAALEAGDWQELPGDVVGRGFLRNYARFLGVDPQEAQARLRDGEPSPPPVPPPVGAPVDPEALVAGEEALQAPVETRPEQPSGVEATEQSPTGYTLLEESLFEPMRVPWLRILGSLLLVLALAAVGFGSWSYWNNPQLLVNLGILKPTASPTPTTLVPRITRITATPSDTPTATPVPSDTATLRPTRTATSTPTLTPTVRATPAEGLEVFVNVAERSWVEVLTDDQLAFVGLLEKGEYQGWQAEDRIRMTVGNAGGLEVSINGEQLGFLGELDEVVFIAWELEQGGRILQMRLTPPAETPATETPAPEETVVPATETPQAESTPGG